MLKAGDLIHAIIIEQPVTETIPGGGLRTTWSRYGVRLAKVETVSAAERQEDHQQHAESKVEVGLWWDTRAAAIRPDMRILWRNDAYYVTGVSDPDGRRRELLITATAKRQG